MGTFRLKNSGIARVSTGTLVLNEIFEDTQIPATDFIALGSSITIDGTPHQVVNINGSGSIIYFNSSGLLLSSGESGSFLDFDLGSGNFYRITYNGDNFQTVLYFDGTSEPGELSPGANFGEIPPPPAPVVSIERVGANIRCFGTVNPGELVDVFILGEFSEPGANIMQAHSETGAWERVFYRPAAGIIMARQRVDGKWSEWGESAFDADTSGRTFASVKTKGTLKIVTLSEDLAPSTGAPVKIEGVTPAIGTIVKYQTKRWVKTGADDFDYVQVPELILAPDFSNAGRAAFANLKELRG